MKGLFWIALVMIVVGFAGLLFLPAAILTRPLVYAMFGSCSVGCILMVYYGAKTKADGP